MAELLLQSNYVVVGVTRKASESLWFNLNNRGIKDQVVIVETEIDNVESCTKLLLDFKPDEVYNLAAQSSVSYSFQNPLESIQFNVSSVINLLEAIRNVNKSIRFYQASSSEMYGVVNDLPITINSVLHPVSPYGISKATGHWLVSQYRESYGLYAVSGVLFNHESFLRPESFFVKKVVSTAVKMYLGSQQDLHVGSIDIKRDFGYAKDYVKAIYLMMQNAKPKDYLICSGTSISLRDIIYYVFDKLDLSKNRIIVDQSLKRPSEIDDIYGDPLPAQIDLGWESAVSFFDVLDILIEEEILNAKSGSE